MFVTPNICNNIEANLVQVREQFTQHTALELWNANPDYETYHAAICYNKRFHVQNPEGIAEVGTARLQLGRLKSEYVVAHFDNFSYELT